MSPDNFRAMRNRAPGDSFMSGLEHSASAEFEMPVDPLDSPESLALHKKLLGWYFMERDRQAENRLEMATDCDFYDNQQWDEDDAQAVRARGQMPLVYNEIAPVMDWLIGTERRSRVDWSILPRTEDDVENASIKTKLMKYLSDVNKIQFVRSQAFEDAIKAGVGWIDDGARDDPTQEMVYTRYEDWRNVLWDSAGSYDLGLSDARYIFRWRDVDEDVAEMMFEGRQHLIREAMEDHDAFSSSSDDEFSGSQFDATGVGYVAKGSGVAGAMDSRRRRVRLIEAQFKIPTRMKIVTSGMFKGSMIHPNDERLLSLAMQDRADIIDKVTMRTHFAVMTQKGLLALAPSIYRHNRYTLTPIWCYRRGRDRLPYGAGRRIRDGQKDLNKRASKALHIFNSNQVIHETGAIADLDKFMDELGRPDGELEVTGGALSGGRVQIRRDSEMANGQLQMMQLAAEKIQRSAGVNDDNRGIQTNASSGEAIKARQQQGSVVNTQCFDNLRLATQISGEKRLSVAEQFMTQERVVRLTGSKDSIEWVKINQPVQNPDGSVSILNDITSSQADFVVAEQDYAGTMRQVMFESMSAMASRMPPDVAMRLYIIAMDFSDMANKAEIVDAMRKVIGERDPNQEPSPEEQQAAQQEAQAKQDAMDMQRQTNAAMLAKAQGEARKINADAAKAESDVQGGGEGLQINEIRAAADREIEALSAKLQDMQRDYASQILTIKKDSDTRLEIARIDQETKLRVAEIERVHDQRLVALQNKISVLANALSSSRAEEAGEPETTFQPVATDAQEGKGDLNV